MLAEIFLAMALAIPGVRRVVPLNINAAAPNPASEVVRIFEPNFGEMEQAMNEFAPRRPAATLDDLMDSIEDADAELQRAIDAAERLIEHKRTLVATMRARLDLEDADIAKRMEQVAKMREALRAEPTTAEPVEPEAQS